MKYYKIIIVFCFCLIIAGCKNAEVPVQVETPSTNGTISGRVTSAILAEGPIIQALVTTNPATASVATDIFGYYLIENVKPGTYTVSAFKTGYDSLSTKVQVNANLISTGDIKLRPSIPGIVRGVVANAVNGSPISEATITTNPYVGSIKTDANGAYTISNIKIGSYTITAEKFGFTTKINTIVVVADSVKTVDFVLMPSYGTLTGTVTDSNKVVIPGVNITTTPSSSSVLTDSLGKYTISPIASGAVTISAKKGGWKATTVLVSITVGNNTIGDVIMAK